MTTSLLKGRRFYCREWVFGKVSHCLESRNTAKTCGTLVMGGPGCGKTALCCELVWPTGGDSSKQAVLSQRSLAHYFCQAHDIETLSITNFIHCLVDQLSKSDLIEGYEERLQETSVQAVLDPHTCELNPDDAFKTAVLMPLQALNPPPQNLFILVDSVDESYLQSPLPSGERKSTSRTIAELLAKHHMLFPEWLLLICTARKQSKSVTRLFTGFRKIGLDDLRKSHVVRDVQQYILCRLDQEAELRQHLSRETAEMLNQLHIKSNGCFLYLERVLDGVANSFILLREIREIPGTLNGLYLWLCQRLFVRKQFAKVQPLLNVILAARRPLTEMELYSCAYTRNITLTVEEFRRRIELLAKILIEGKDGTKILFHHSFAEWLLDVKHCTQKYLCRAAEGHAMLAMSFTMHAPSLTAVEIQDFALHLARSGLAPPIEQHHLALWMLQSGANVEDSLMPPNDLPRDPAVLRLLVKAGARLPPSQGATSLPLPGDTPSPAHVDHSEDLDREGVDELDSNGRTLLCKAAHKGDLTAIKLLINKGADLEIVDKGGQCALSLASRQGHADVVGTLLGAGARTDHTDSEGWTALRCAAWGGHTTTVERLLEGGAEVDHADTDGRTALRAAAWGGHEDIVIRLLQAGAGVNKVDKEGRTALIAAAYMGHHEICEHLLQHGADINHEDIDGRTALSVAALCIPASEGHERVVSLLLERGAQVDHQDRDGMTPLLVAAYEGHHSVCELLLEADADVDHWDHNNRTPLQAAASMGHAQVINLLLFWGAAVDTIDNDGRTVLCIAAQQGNVEVVRQLLDRGLDEMHRDNAGWTPLHLASYEGHKQVVEVLLECGARQTEVDNDGRIPLLLAAQEGHLEVVEVLLNAGSPIEARAHDGKTALRLAALEGHPELVQFLLETGAQQDYTDADGRSTLYVLALENQVEMAKILLENGANTEAADLEGRTPLHVAAWQGHYQMADILLQHGAKPDGVDADRRTALQSAAWQGHANIVRLLLDHGASVDHTCNQGATALCIAAQEGHEQVVRVLLQYRADPNHADQYGRTATRVALKGGHKKVVKLLEEHGANTTTRTPAAVPTATITKPTSASQALASALAIANGHINGSASESPGSTFDKKKPTGAAVSSSSNMNTASTNQSGGSGQGEGPMTFTQQLQQCSLGKNRGKASSKILSPLSEPDSPASAPGSPLYANEDYPIHPARLSPAEIHSHSCHKASPRRHDYPGGNPVRIISNPHMDMAELEGGDEPVWQPRHQPDLNIAKLELTRKGSMPEGPTPMSGITMGQAALGMKSPESRRKRNGIVTNPNYSLTKNVNINGYYNKLSETMEPGYSPPSPSASPQGAGSSSSTPSLPTAASASSKVAKPKATRPNGLPLKKETPL